MPLLTFSCDAGHLTDRLVRNRDTKAIPCPACFEPAFRQSVYHFGIGGKPPPRYRVTEFQEAAQEANYYHDRMENLKGESIPRIDAVKESKRKARSLGAKVKA